MRYGTIWLPMLALAALVGVVTGGFPGLILSRFDPVDVLKSRLRIGGPARFSRCLVVLQFVFSIILITVTLIMSRQMAHLRARDLGFNAEQVVAIDTGGYASGFSVEEKGRVMSVYRQVADQYPDVVDVSAADMSFAPPQVESRGVTYRGHREWICYFRIDYDYVETLGVELVEGRDFSREHETDVEDALLVNEALVEFMGWDSGIGKTPQALRPDSKDFDKTIVGVVKDFHFRPLHMPIQPAVFHLCPDRGLRYNFVRIAPSDLPGTIALLRDRWNRAMPDRPFVYSFLDEDVERTFRESERWIMMTRYAALFAIFIACLGAFGLTSLAVARRTKEIGIRKVLGASASNIVLLLSKEFVKLVILANLIAWPIAYYAMNRWLQDFAYRIDLGVGMFVLGGVLALMIVLLTVSSQAMKAATANPVDALRYE